MESDNNRQKCAEVKEENSRVGDGRGREFGSENSRESEIYDDVIERDDQRKKCTGVGGGEGLAEGEGRKHNWGERSRGRE